MNQLRGEAIDGWTTPGSRGSRRETTSYCIHTVVGSLICDDIDYGALSDAILLRQISASFSFEVATMLCLLVVGRWTFRLPTPLSHYEARIGLDRS